MACASPAFKAGTGPAACKVALILPLLPPVSRAASQGCSAGLLRRAAARRPCRLLIQHRRLIGSGELAEVIGEGSLDLPVLRVPTVSTRRDSSFIAELSTWIR